MPASSEHAGILGLSSVHTRIFTCSRANITQGDYGRIMRPIHIHRVIACSTANDLHNPARSGEFCAPIMPSYPPTGRFPPNHPPRPDRLSQCGKPGDRPRHINPITPRQQAPNTKAAASPHPPARNPHPNSPGASKITSPHRHSPHYARPQLGLFRGIYAIRQDSASRRRNPGGQRKVDARAGVGRAGCAVSRSARTTASPAGVAPSSSSRASIGQSFS